MVKFIVVKAAIERVGCPVITDNRPFIGQNPKCNGYYTQKGSMRVIFIKPTEDENKMAVVLTHEAVHLIQNMQGRFITQDPTNALFNSDRALAIRLLRRLNNNPFYDKSKIKWELPAYYMQNFPIAVLKELSRLPYKPLTTKIVSYKGITYKVRNCYPI